MALGDKIVSLCDGAKGITAEKVWTWAKANGWGNAKDAKGRWLAWCAATVSYFVWLASNGVVTTAFGMKPKRSRFRCGNVSVPQTWEDAVALGVFTKEPRPGMPVFIELRHGGRPWPVRPGHIGIVVAVKRNAAGVAVSIVTQEGNYANKYARVNRPMVAAKTAKERVFGFVDIEKYAATIGVADTLQPEDDESYECSLDDDTCADLFPVDADVMAIADGELMPRRCRVCGLDDDGAPFLQPTADDGQVLMEEQPWAPGTYTITGHA